MTISVDTVSTPRVEAFYWAAITFSQTLGTALGDWMADTGGLGYEGGALVFAAGLAVIAGLYFWSGVSRVLLFWECLGYGCAFSERTRARGRDRLGMYCRPVRVGAHQTQ
jgi:uncharacterized membrane-anchored protein